MAPQRAAVAGIPWPSSALSLTLGPGVESIAYPRGVPSSETASELQARAAAYWVVRVVSSSGHGRFEAFVPGLSAPFALRDGAGYLLAVPASRSLTPPSR
ncbi:MAG: hypothetical protein HY303_06605 [Candidatus Wallbacteria bacterium]|nr:hypothetical protein [Candidatus Wallbacteria bacterium]